MDARTPFHLRGPERSTWLTRAVAGVAGFLAAGVAVVVGAVLAVFAAATVAVLAVMTSLLVLLTGAVFRARRGAAPARAEVLEARKVGHAWVAYGWDSRGG
jgi:hypothetical protein